MLGDVTGELHAGASDPGVNDLSASSYAWTVTASNGQVVSTAGWGTDLSFTPNDKLATLADPAVENVK